jgi:hypothetical protein
VDGRYKRLSPHLPDRNERWLAGRESLLIPTDPETVDYRELLQEALEAATKRFAVASSDNELRALLALSALDDVIKFSKESELAEGEIDWMSGESMVESLRVSLLSSAKATVEKKSYFGHKFANFASRYLSTVRMGQTERGSFIVTAHSRASTQIPTSNSAKFREQSAIEGAVITAGEISATLTRALSTARDAIDESHTSGGLDVFRDAVSDGVSKDLMAALKLATESRGYTITSIARADDAGSLQRPSIVTFEQRDFAVIERAETFLAAAAPKEKVVVTGWVKVLSRPKQGTAGVVSVVVLSGSKASQIKVRLSEDQFAIASDAIKQERLIQVRGTQERDGSAYWIYDPAISTTEPQPPTAETGRLLI